MENLKEIIIGIAAVLTAVSTIWGGVRSFRKRMVELSSLIDCYEKTADFEATGMRTLLKYRLTITCQKVIKRGWMTTIEGQLLDDGMKAYEGLDGNGDLLALYKLTKDVERRYLTPDELVALGDAERHNRV